MFLVALWQVLVDEFQQHRPDLEVALVDIGGTGREALVACHFTERYKDLLVPTDKTPSAPTHFAPADVDKHARKPRHSITCTR